MQEIKISQVEMDAHHFKNVESYCGAARLALRSALDSAAHIVNDQLREDATETLKGTLEDILTIYKGEENVPS